MTLLHDRYLASHDRACDLVTGEERPVDQLGELFEPPDDERLAPVIELFEQGRDGTPRWIVAEARNGMQAAALSRRTAAAARRRGVVAVAVSLYQRWRDRLDEELFDRTLLLIGGFGEAVAPARAALATAASVSPRPHVLLTFRTSTRGGSIVREARAVYGASALARPVVTPEVSWPPDVEQHLRRGERAAAFARAGCHAAAERLFRDVAGALERRRACAPAARTTLTLAALLIERGRPGAAEERSRDAVRLAEAGQAAALASEARAWEAWARIDQGRLTEAESILRAVLLTAEARGARAWAAAGLARCLLWQERADEALAVAESCDPPPDLSPAQAASAGEVAVCAALAAGHVFVAGQWSRRAVEAAAASDDALAAVIAHSAHLRVLCAAGDLALAGASLAAVLDLARRAHAPLRATWARLVWLDALRRAERSQDAKPHAARLARVAGIAPPLLKRAIEARLRQGSGEANSRPAGAIGGDSGRTPDALEAVSALAPSLVHLSNEDAEDQVAIRRVLERVSRELNAGRIDLVSGAAGPVTTVLSVGSGVPTTVGRRVLESGVAVGWDGPGESREAGMPVRPGVQLLGALVGRWPLDRAIPGAARATLDLTAAILGPRIEAAQLKARHAAAASAAVPELVGLSAGMEEVRRAVALAARAPFAVVIEGESGTGKELVARAIHQLGSRRDRRFCDVNCAALPDELLESELFGHARGAFTGAVHDRVGLFEEADGGTLFMDEVAELSARAQAKLLRVVQQQELRRVGESFTRAIDVRLIAAANRDLHAEVDAGRFRHDLLYRLNVVRIRIPPLRDRPGDVAMLAQHFWMSVSARVGSRAVLTPAVLAELARYPWPGNVRELQNVMAALAVVAPVRGRVASSLLPAVIGAASVVTAQRLDEARDQFERRFIDTALAQAGGSRTRAAAALGVSRQGLLKMMARHRMSACSASSPGGSR